MVQRLVDIAQAAKQHVDSIAEASDDPGMHIPAGVMWWCPIVYVNCVHVCMCVCVWDAICRWCFTLPIQKCRQLPTGSHWSMFCQGFIAIVVIVTWILLQL